MRVSFYNWVAIHTRRMPRRQRKKEFTQRFAAALTTRNGAILDACTHPKSNQHRAERVPGNLIDAVNGWENLHFRTEHKALGASTRIAE
jgi:hypothetical protein